MIFSILQLWASFTLALFSLPDGTYYASKATKAPVIDGSAADPCWKKAAWAPINELWLGKPYSKEDFQGRYKIVWNQNSIFILAEIIDDTLADTHPNGLDRYWDDDCLEVFLDEDHSGGEHLASFNAWAYHSALDNKTVDYGADGKPHYYSNHVNIIHSTKGNTTVWEGAYSLYKDTYQDGKPNKPVVLTKGKNIGFAIAYCDNDHSAERENFIGSVAVAGEDKNQGYKNATIFGSIVLK